MAEISAGKLTQNRLEINDLFVARADIPIFNPVNLSLSAGEALRVSGVNGAGKTTLLRAICGLCNSHEGQVKWNGVAINTTGSSFYQNLLYLGHSLGLKPKLTAEQNLNFYRDLRFPANPELVREALEQTGVGQYFDEYVARMSAGQKRRVALARILTEPVPLWVLDEPLVALDVKGQGWLETICNKHLENGGILLITSHQPIAGIHNLQELNLT